MNDNHFTLLYEMVRFVKENYEPFKDVHEDDLALMMYTSYEEGTIMPIITGSGPSMGIVACYEYWKVTQEYLDKLGATEGQTMPVPSNGERSGDILFCPILVLSNRLRGKAFNLTRLALSQLEHEYPDAPGIYRWVLKEQKLHYMPFNSKEG